MSLTADQVRGGSTYVGDADVTVPVSDTRIYVFQNTAARTATLPNARRLGVNHRVLLINLAASTSNVSVQVNGGAALSASNVVNFTSAVATPGQIVELHLLDNTTAAGRWVTRFWSHNPANGAQVYSTRPNAVADLRADRGPLSTTGCYMGDWKLTNCQDDTDVIFSRQRGWLQYENMPICLSIDDPSLYRLVERAPTITATPDTRDLVSLVVATKLSCDVGFVDTWTFLDRDMIDWRQALAVPDKTGYTRNYATTNGTITATSSPQTQVGERVGDPVVGSPWTLLNNGLTVRFDFEDDNNCAAPRGTPNTGGYNPNLHQGGSAIATIEVAAPTDMTVDFSGQGERQASTFELLTLTVNKGLPGAQVVASATSPGGGLGCPGGNGPAVLTSGTNPVTVSLPVGTHTLTVDTDSNDELYHIGAFYQINISFAPTP